MQTCDSLSSDEVYEDNADDDNSSNNQEDDSLSDDVEILKKRLCRRLDLLDWIRKSYLRDVIIVKEVLLGFKSQTAIDLSPLDSIPSLDLTVPLKLFAPHDSEIRMNACEKCGGSMDIVHTESTKIEKLQKLLDEMYVREMTARTDQAEVQNTLDKVKGQYDSVLSHSTAEKEILIAKILKLQEEADKYPPSMMAAMQTRLSILVYENETKTEELSLARLDLEQSAIIDGENICLKTQLETMELRYDAASKSLRDMSKKMKESDTELIRTRTSMSETSDRCRRLENDIRSEYQARERSEKQTAFMKEKMKELRRALQSAETRNDSLTSPQQAQYAAASDIDWNEMMEKEMASYIAKNFPSPTLVSHDGISRYIADPESGLQQPSENIESNEVKAEGQEEEGEVSDEQSGQFFSESNEFEVEDGQIDSNFSDAATGLPGDIVSGDGVVGGERTPGQAPSIQPGDRIASRRSTAPPSNSNSALSSKVSSRQPSRGSSRLPSRGNDGANMDMRSSDLMGGVSLDYVREIEDTFAIKETELKEIIAERVSEIATLQTKLSTFEDEIERSSKTLADAKERAMENESQLKDDFKKSEKKLRSDLAKSKRHGEETEAEVENLRRLVADACAEMCSFLSNVTRCSTYSNQASVKLQKLIEVGQVDSEAFDARHAIFEAARKSFGVHLTQVTPLIESLISGQGTSPSQISGIFSNDIALYKKLTQFSEDYSASSFRILNDFFGSIDNFARNLVAQKRESDMHHSHEQQRLQTKLESQEKINLDKMDLLKEKIRSKDEQIKDLKEVKLVKLSGEVSQLRVQVSNIARLQDEKASMQLVMESLQKQLVDKSEEGIRSKAMTGRLEREISKMKEDEDGLVALIESEKRVSANLEEKITALECSLEKETNNKLDISHQLSDVIEHERLRLETNVNVEIDATVSSSDVAIQTEFMTPDFSLRFSCSDMAQLPNVGPLRSLSHAAFINEKLSPSVYVGPPIKKKTSHSIMSNGTSPVNMSKSSTLPSLLAKPL